MTRCATSALALTIAAAGLAAAPASAQQGQTAASSEQLQEIVVTAAKRAGTVQETPISISAFSGQDIQDRGITDFNDLAASTPGVSLKEGGPGQTEFEIRGLTSSGGNSPTVGFYLDDIALTAPSAAQNGKVVIDPSLYDLNRVEVLRGPQGTLYGSSSMGGTIKLVTNQPDPDQFDASAQSIMSATDGGGFNHGENVMVNIPLADGNAAIRFVGSEAYTSGWINRTVIACCYWQILPNGQTNRAALATAPVAQNFSDVNDEELLGGRASILWKPLDNFTLTASILWQRITQDGPNWFDSEPSGVPLTHYEVYNEPEPFSDRFILWSVTANYKFEDFDVTSATGKWNRSSNIVQDQSDVIPFLGLGPTGVYPPTGAGAANIDEDDYSKQFSEEVRITSTGDTRFKWLVGSYYSSFESDWDLVSFINGFIPFDGTNDEIDQTQPTNITQTAAFGEMSYNILDDLKLTGGLRWYSYQAKLVTSLNGLFNPFPNPSLPFPASSLAVSSITENEADEGFNPKFDISYQPDKDLTVYATASKGFRPGGGNQPLATAFGCPANTPRTFQPDSVWNYETGEKARLLDNRLTVNADVYYEDWAGVQQEVLPACGFPYNANEGDAHIYGSELEIHAVLVPGLVLSTSTGYAHAFLTENTPVPGEPPFFKGERLQDVPTWTGGASLSYSTEISDGLTLTGRIDNSYVGTRRSGNYASVSSINGQLDLPAYDLTNLRIGLEGDSWTAFAFVNNVADKRAWIAYNNLLSVNPTTYNRVTTNQPLTAGIDISWHFSHAEAPVEAAPPAPPPPAPAAPPPAPQVEAQRQFQVFFDFDKSDITAAAAKVIEAAAAAVKQGNVVHVAVTGHTDTVGTASYNQGLSERRAAAVKAALVKDGVAGDEIATIGVGKTGLLVPTGDGVREAQNRRAVIELQ